jgi:ATPase subunit of ABC transporter with duplicated ATPase domains
MSELQGGQKVRVLLAQALFGKPQALLLDEPTNYLDLDSIHWLQDFLEHFEGTLITISHDRHFLNSVCTHIADIDYETIITYTGGYDDMVVAKTQIRSRLESQNEQREKKIAQLNEFIARFSAGTRSSQVEKDFRTDGGTVKWGHEAQVGYFPQDVSGLIDKGTTVAEWLHNFDPQASNEDIRGILGQMLFRGEEGLKPTDALSGGEAARLLFCRLMMQKPNILALDEPTNHLDLESINALNIALQRYEGTVLLVTHDHDLIDEVATRIWHFDGSAIEDFKGPYEEYLAATSAVR